MGLPGCVLEDRDKRRRAVAFDISAAYQMAGAFGRNHRHVHVFGWHHLVKVDIEAVREHQHIARLETRLNRLSINLTLGLVGQQNHNNVGLFAGFFDGFDR